MTNNLNGSAVYVIGIVVTAVFSLAAFIAIEVLRPGMDNALLYGQVFLFAGTIITGLFGAMKTKENKVATVETNRVVSFVAAQVATIDKKADDLHDKVDGLNTAALVNQAKVSEAKGHKEGVADAVQIVAALSTPPIVPSTQTITTVEAKPDAAVATLPKG